jgi:hypothetical protein
MTEEEEEAEGRKKIAQTPSCKSAREDKYKLQQR